MPTLHLIGGPNGAGKSTNSIFLPRYKKIARFDPDEFIVELISQGIEDEQDQIYSIKLKVEELLENRESFSFESNLHKSDNYSIVKLAKQHRYKTELTFISLDEVSNLYDRVEERAALGKHNIPKATILKRYQDGLSLLPSYINHFDKVRLVDSTELKLANPIVISKYKPFFRPSYSIPKWCDIVIDSYFSQS
jgi:predicted ABC-type ATPase